MKRYICNILLGVSLAAFIFALVFNIVSKDKDNIFIFGYKPYFIASGSMEPEYKVNMAVIIKNADFETAKVGDVIAFKGFEDKTIFHRIIAIEEGGFITKGDNNECVDSAYVTKEKFIGIGVYKTNIVNIIVKKFSTIKGVIFYLILPICSYLLAKKAIKVFRSAE
jgi:signal peptidase I, archaeal type